MENSAASPAQAEAAALNCLDLADPDIAKSVSLLKQACLDSGFFHVINHGISAELMEDVFVQSKRFFSLPMEEKMKLLRNKKNRGYTPPHDETLDPDNQINGDYKEGYYIGLEFSEDDPQSEKPFYGPNLWPSEDLLHEWRETMERFHCEALKVARAVARFLALALDLEVDFFDKPEMLDNPIAVLRLLHYEGRASEPSKGIFGAGAHSDFGLMTLLATDGVPGLQICKDKNVHPRSWQSVQPIKGGFLVNLGDMLERWSNGIFRSTLHRVLIGTEERYSVAFFVEPSHECVVECLPSCWSETNPPKFSPVTCASYLMQRYQETHRDIPGQDGPQQSNMSQLIDM